MTAVVALTGVDGVGSLAAGWRRTSLSGRRQTTVLDLDAIRAPSPAKRYIEIVTLSPVDVDRISGNFKIDNYRSVVTVS